MRILTPKLSQSFVNAGIASSNLAESDGLKVSTFRELKDEMTKLACVNSDYVLFYRGQHTDYKRTISTGKKGSSILPSIYRLPCSEAELELRWRKLERASEELKKVLTQYMKGLGKRHETTVEEIKNILKRRSILWSMIQHYELAQTPLIDVTQSLKVACSFALLDAEKEFSYIYAFALPYNTGRISLNSEHELTNIRLLSIAPSFAKRPHYQEGFLIGEDEMNYGDKFSGEYDLRRRLIGKFRIPNSEQFWTNSEGGPVFHEHKYDREDLYPGNDEFESIIHEVKAIIANTAPQEATKNQAEIGIFVTEWRRLESILNNMYPREQYSTLHNQIKAIGDSLVRRELNELRILRNNLVHASGIEISSGELHVKTDQLHQIADFLDNKLKSK